MTLRFHINFPCLFYVLVLIAGIFYSVPGNTELSENIEEYRIHVALKLFPRIAATDEHIKEKLDTNGKINLLIYYVEQKQKALQLTQILHSNIKSIGNLNIKYHFDNTLDKYSGANKQPAAIFLAEPLSSAELQKLINYCQENDRLLFSPFEGDVERGVTAGVFIGNKITPYFNMEALSLSHIDINERLLRVSTQYE